jgi:hypothetical protein
MIKKSAKKEGKSREDKNRESHSADVSSKNLISFCSTNSLVLWMLTLKR